MIMSVISLRPRCWWRMAARSPGPFPSRQAGTAAGAAPVLSAAISGAAPQKEAVGTRRWEPSPGTGTRRQHRDGDPDPLPDACEPRTKSQLPPPPRRPGLTRSGARAAGGRDREQRGETHQPRCKRSRRAAASARPAPAGSPPATRSWARAPRAAAALRAGRGSSAPLPPPARSPLTPPGSRRRRDDVGTATTTQQKRSRTARGAGVGVLRAALGCSSRDLQVCSRETWGLRSKGAVKAALFLARPGLG